MSNFGRRKKIFIACILFIAAVAAGYLIEYLEKDAFVEEKMITAVDQEYFKESDHIIDGKININSAAAIEFCELPGIGEKLAQRIIDYRTQNGKFEQIEGIMLVPGIGEGLFETIKDKICAE